MRHSISIMSLNNKRQLIIFGNLHWTNILHARNQDKSSFLHVFTINNNTKKMVSQNAACFDQAKFKNTSRHCRCWLHYRHCERLCVNIKVTLQHDVTWEIKRKKNLNKINKNPYQSCEKRKKAAETNSKLAEFYLGFQKRCHVNYRAAICLL